MHMRAGIALILVAVAIAAAIVISGPSWAHTVTAWLLESDAVAAISLGTISGFMLIWLKNVIACGIVALTSGYLRGLPIVLFIAVNATVMGAVIAVAGASWALVPYLVPHGVFELAAIAISLGMGWHIWRKHERVTRAHVRRFAVVVVPLLFVAGLVEAYVTPVAIRLWG